MKRVEDTETVELMRGGSVVSTLTGAFGHALKETRLTAMLGYLIALEPEPFLALFGLEGSARRVSLETRHENGRSDILIETSRGVGVIEAKIDASDPLQQSSRYPADWIVLLTHAVPRKRQMGRVCYVKWQELSDALRESKRSSDASMRLLGGDFLKYLEEHHMIRGRDAVEIYAREINEPLSLQLFLQGHIYSCLYKRGSRLSEALYFAPHFGKQISKLHPGVGVGISYISKI